MDDTVGLFKQRLDKFIDKHYKSLLIKGLCSFLSITVATLILFSSLELLFELSSSARLFLLVLFVLLTLSAFFYFLLVPSFRLFGILPRMSYAEACKIIQSKDVALKDILTNIIELSSLPKSDLVNASIEQKIKLTNEINFTTYVSYQSKKHFVVCALSLISLIICVLFAPNLFKTGFSNIVHFQRQTIENQQFSIYIDESKLSVEQGNDLLIEATVKGISVADEMFVKFHGNLNVMQKVNDSLFAFTFKNVNNSFSFSLTYSNKESKNYNVKVLKVPTVNDYYTEIYCPKYTNIKDTIVKNQNILVVPQGTFLKQTFSGLNIDTLTVLSLKDSSSFILPCLNNYTYETKVFYNDNYRVVLSNTDIKRNFIDFKLVSIPDEYPQISVSKIEEQTGVSFNGSIKDDYGFTKLLLYVSAKGSNDTLQIPIYNNITSQQIFYNYQTNISSDIYDKPVSFCFELYDNDGVNGPKKVRSEILDFVVKSISSQVADKEEKYSDLFTRLELTKQLSEEIEFEISELRKKMLNDNLTEWEKNSMLQQINNKTNQLQELLNNISKDHKSLENSFNNSQQIIEKQNLISELLNSLIDDELKEILKEISELAAEKQQNYNALSEDLKKDFGNFEKEVDRNIELLKKMKIEENISQLAENLEVLSDKQNQLSSQQGTDSVKSELNKQKEFFDDLKNQYQKLTEDNESLERPYKIDDFSSEFNQIDSNFDIENQQLDDNNLQEFEKSVKDNSSQIKKLSDNMKQMFESSKADSDAEDADDLRQILDNLFEVSFSQEKIITEYESVIFSNPLYQERILAQSQLVENFKIVRDSLYNLSRRTIQLGSHISKAAYLIEDGMMESCVQLQERNTSKANRNQREALKNTNDLILILSESLKNIENSPSGAGGKSAKKRKPKPKPEQQLSEMRSAQESMKNQLRDLLNQMKSGESEATNRELAKMLMQNEIYQQMLEQMMRNADIDGQTAKLLQEAKKLMEKSHTEFANKKLSIQTVMRQQNIVNKLLDAENAETERDTDDKRESTTAKNIDGKTPKNFQEDITFEKNMDVLKQTNLKLNSFYKAKFDEYLNSVNNVSNE